jgi:hypothetical protein
MPTIVIANAPDTILRIEPRESAREENHVLPGTWLEVTPAEERDGWIKVTPRPNRGKGGWVKKTDVRDDPPLRVFFVDVG